MKYGVIGIGLLFLAGCGGSGGSDDGTGNDGGGIDIGDSAKEITSDALKESAVSVDGYEQITITQDSNLKLTLKDGEAFSLSSSDGETPEKLIVQGKLTITSN